MCKFLGLQNTSINIEVIISELRKIVIPSLLSFPSLPTSSYTAPPFNAPLLKSKFQPPGRHVVMSKNLGERIRSKAVTVTYHKTLAQEG